jgi:hypothetical protein
MYGRESLLWRLLTGDAPYLGLALLALVLLAGYVLGAPLVLLAIGGSAGLLLVTGLLLTRYCLLLAVSWLAFLVWAGILPSPV